MQPIAFLFPGQGSQFVGMGQTLYQEYDFVRELFDMAEEITKTHLSKLCFQGPIDVLTQTVHLQPAVTVVNLACLSAIVRQGVQPSVSAGHSLGEYAALQAAGVLSAEDALRLVYHRGVLMHREALKHSGAMHAILGLTIESVAPLVKDARRHGRVSIANHNTDRQIVITGEPAAVQHASTLAVTEGAKSVPLNVSGAWHSELIRGAEEDFRHILSETSFHPPRSRVIFNVTADSASDPSEIRDIMARQLCSPVKWYDSIRLMADSQEMSMVEVGPGKVLSGIVRKILPKDSPVSIYQVNDLITLERFLKDHT